MALACGVDFGTSNTAVALWRDGEVLPVPVDLASTIPLTIPTLLYFPPSGVPSYGAAAVADYLAQDMVGRLIQAIKRYLPSESFTGTVVGGKPRGIEELVAGFLVRCKAAAEALAGAPVRAVLMGRPAVFHVDPARDRLAQQRLEAGARLAGFEEVQFQLEPIAAARAFERELTADTLCLIGDLGGGTSDFTVIRLGPGRVGSRDRAGDVLGSTGVDVGGNDVDARLIQAKVLRHFGFGCQWRPLTQWVPLPTALHMAATRWHRLCVEAAEPKNLRWLDQAIPRADDPDGLRRFRIFLARNAGYTLFRSVERAKVELSDRDVTTLAFNEVDIAFTEPVTRAELETAIAHELRRLERCLDGLLARLELRPDDIGTVFLTGGTSLIPAVRALFEARFPGRILEPEAFTAVGQGLGVEAGERFFGALRTDGRAGRPGS